MSLVLGVIGEAFSGKDTLAEYLAKKYDVFAISHSSVLDEILNILDLPISRKNEIDLGIALRQAFSTGIVAQGLRKKVQKANNQLIVIQSIRFPEELVNAKDFGARIVYIEASEEARFKRAQQREEKTDDQQTLEEFRLTAQKPTEVGIQDLAKEAEFLIDNNGDLENFYAQIDEIMAQLEK